MNDELKSAVDLALEKLDKEMGKTIPTLSEDQKERIAEIRSKYQARMAEVEISAQSEIRKLVQTGSFEAVDAIKERESEDKRRFHSEMESKIAKIREE